MTIEKIYDRYKIPYNLRSHMYRVAGVGKVVCDHVNSINLNCERIVKTLLLHDMGNILKFDLDNPLILEGQDKNQVDILKNVQQSFRGKYGDNCDDATIAILHEISVDSEIIALVKESHDTHIAQFMNHGHWEQKICYYSDMRVGPFGVLSLAQRFEDLKKRYPHSVKKIDRNYIQCCHIEELLQEVTTIDIVSIDEKQIEQEFTYLKQVSI